MASTENTAPASQIAQPPASTPQTGGHIGMWDSFEHILMFISLYVMATSIGLILNLYVDKWVPSATPNYYSFSNRYSPFPGYAAALIVSFPFFAYFFLETTKRRLKLPELMHLKSRKILIYLTLVGTFIIMLVSLISIVFSLLSGNISFNFALHFLVSITIAGIIFFYFLREVRADRNG